MSEQENDDDLEVKIEIEEEEPQQQEDEPKVVKPEDGVEELKRQLEAERARRQDAERLAHEASERERLARNDKDDSDIQLVSNAIQTLNRDGEILKANYAAALRNGDFARAAEINDEISETKAQLQQLNNGLEAMKSKPKVQPQPPRSADPVEAFASQLTARSAEWVRAHPDYVRDPKMNRKMIAAHELAVADGIAPDTDAYFAAIEETLRIKPQAAPVVPQDDDASSAAAKVTQRRDAAPAAAPVSRGGSNRSNVVRLTSAEREMAEMMGMKPEDYAKNKMALQKEGKLQ
ncbi:endopeptidase clp ATP-binding subunit C [Caudoviricetes sp.]|nr:endopeptidase clp ATP-binding subunit C [Caudoviricetes sp.]